MENDARAITVYGASSPAVDDIYKEAAKETGRLIALSGHALVSGGGRTGLMGAAIEGACAACGKTIGVLPRFMDERGWGNHLLSEKIVTPDMHTRKAAMMNMSLGAIALPGGVGTFEELMEAITWRQLNIYRGNVVILNTAGYYDPLLEMLQRTIEQHFMRDDHTDLWQVASTPSEAVKIVTSATAHCDFSQKIPDTRN